MDPIAAILLSVQTQLGARVPELAYIDKDWGQLSYEVPSVKWPCALLDVENVNYTQEGGGRQMADTQLTITVADMRLTPIAYEIGLADEHRFDLLEEKRRLRDSIIELADTLTVRPR